MDIIGLDYFLNKKYIDTSNFITRVHCNAFCWGLSTLLITNLLSIVTSNRGEEMDYSCFLICLKEAAYLVKIKIIFSSWIIWLQ